MITIKIDSFDRSAVVDFNTIKKTDILNAQVDTLEFTIFYSPSQTFRPEPGSEIEMFDGAVKVFGGRIYAIEKANQGDGSVAYTIKAQDYTYDLDRLLVNEEYDDKTVEEIIAEIVENYAPTFTYVNAVCSIVIEKISFSREKITDCLTRLAEITGYSFYIDYDKDVHFFEKNSEPAPFGIVDNNGEYIPDTLLLTNDASQLKNRVFIRGGEIEGVDRTETFNGDGVKKQFKLANKFAHKPTVKVGGATKTVGIDFLDTETDFDCFWDYNNSYVRFTDVAIPGAGTNNIEITGAPLFNLLIQVDEPISILKYGVHEFYKEDRKLMTRETAVRYAESELSAYRDGLIEGEFQTYTAGMRSGQIIQIDSELMDAHESFLIQRVTFGMISPSVGIWKAELATLRTIGIIDFLIGLLKIAGKIQGNEGEIVLEKTLFPLETIAFAEEIDINTDDYPHDETLEIAEDVQTRPDYQPEFVYGPYVPTGTKRPGIFDNSQFG